MIKLSKPITRETAILDRTSPIVVTLNAKTLEMRLKGERTVYTVRWDAVWHLAQKMGAR